MTKVDGNSLIKIISNQKKPIYVHQEIGKIKLLDKVTKSLRFEMQNEIMNKHESNDALILTRTESNQRIQQSNANLISISYCLLLILLL